VTSPEAVEATFGRLREAAAAAGIAWRGALVQATVHGAELLCGMRRDPVFGPAVLIGLGGTLTEVLHDVAVRLCPPSPEDLAELLDECSAGAVIDAVGADRAAIGGVLEALSWLALQHAEVEEVDVNPLFASAQGLWAADALVVTTEEGGSR